MQMRRNQYQRVRLQIRMGSALKAAVVGCAAWSAAHATALRAESMAPAWASSGRIDAALHDRFLAEVPRSWEAVEPLQSDVEVVLEERVRSKSEAGWDEQGASWRYCVAQDTRRKLIALASGDNLSCCNERYSFSVFRSDAQSPFQIRRVKPWAAGAEQPKTGPLGVAEGPLETPFQLWVVPIRHILSDAGFVLTTVERASGDKGEALVTIAYRYDGPELMDPWREPGAIYWGELLPDRSWLVQKSGVDGVHDPDDTPLRVRVITEYQEWAARGAPFPKRVVQEIEDARENAVVETRETVFNTPVSCQRQVEEFFLPYYGLSEASVEALKQRSPWRIGLIVMGALGVVTALSILLRFGKRKTSQPE